MDKYPNALDCKPLRMRDEITALRSESQTLRMQLACVQRDVRMIATRIRAMLKD